MGVEIGGYTDGPDLPKMGPSLLIATALIMAIRTARWPVKDDRLLSNPALDEEIHYAAALAGRILSHLVNTREEIFPQRKQPWYQPNNEDVPQ